MNTFGFSLCVLAAIEEICCAVTRISPRSVCRPHLPFPASSRVPFIPFRRIRERDAPSHAKCVRHIEKASYRSRIGAACETLSLLSVRSRKKAESESRASFRRTMRESDLNTSERNEGRRDRGKGFCGEDRYLCF